ncbi:hypothetical protein Tsubulata_033407 [Turnera subulata]|uniref:RING-type domain-containing protein n=1 Tax=Turnera subulata TaxID=218843 RepID=A0A9Q0G9A3_9ROSI|nr:hypothetical protein Tsubulata_033407 [Turnera subulata]
MKKELKDRFKEQSFKFERNSLTLDDVSRMISEVNIPFPLERLHWRENPKKDGTPLANQDDAIRCIMDLASRAEAGWVSKQELIMFVFITEETILPDNEYEAMVNARRVEELYRSINATFSYWMSQQPRTGRSSAALRRELERMCSEHLRELYDRTGHNSMEAIVENAIRESMEGARSAPRPTPAAKSSIESLEEVMLDGQDSARPCAICFENMEIGSKVPMMPCSHKFHKACIVSWLNRSNICPLCRHKLA